MKSHRIVRQGRTHRRCKAKRLAQVQASALSPDTGVAEKSSTNSATAKRCRCNKGMRAFWQRQREQWNKRKSLKANSERFAELKRVENAAESLRSIRQEWHALGVEYRKWLRHALIKIYEIAVFLREDRDAWVEFCRNPEWDGFRLRPKSDDQGKSLRFVVRFAVGFSKANASKMASKYTKKLQPYFETYDSVNLVRKKLTYKVDGNAKKGAASVSRPKLVDERSDVVKITAPIDSWGQSLVEKSIGDQIVIRARIVEKRGKSVFLQISKASGVRRKAIL